MSNTGPKVVDMPKKNTGKLSPDLTSERAAVICLQDCLAQIETARDRAIANDSPEGPHKLRVGLRRVRTLLGLFRPVIGGTSATRLAAEAKWLGHEAGRTRDLDVFTGEILPQLAPAAAICTHFREVRDRERMRLRKLLTQKRATRFPVGLRGFIQRRGWLDPEDHTQTERLARPTGDFARQALGKRWKKAAKRGDKLRRLSAADRHELRKDLKKLRYAVEFLGPLYPARKTGAFIKRLKKLQDVAGALNDVVTAQRLVEAGQPARHLDPEEREMLDRKLVRLEADMAPKLERMAGLWKDLARTRRPWE